MSKSSQQLNVEVEEVVDDSSPSLNNYHEIDEKVVQQIVYDALVFTTLNGLLVGDKSVQVAATFYH